MSALKEVPVLDTKSPELKPTAPPLRSSRTFTFDHTHKTSPKLPLYNHWFTPTESVNKTISTYNAQQGE